MGVPVCLPLTNSSPPFSVLSLVSIFLVITLSPVLLQATVPDTHQSSHQSLTSDQSLIGHHVQDDHWWFPGDARCEDTEDRSCVRRQDGRGEQKGAAVVGVVTGLSGVVYQVLKKKTSQDIHQRTEGEK